MQQPGLGFDTPPQAPAHNLFFALWPDDGVRAQVQARANALAERFTPRGCLLKPARYHLTLQFLGEHADAPARLIEDAVAAAARVRTQGFDLALDRAGSFHNVWWLGCSQPSAGLQALWQALGTELMQARIKVQSSATLTPHVTVLRDAAARLPSMPIEPLHWPVHEFVLIDSQPPKPYAVLHRWPLADAK